MKKLSLKLSVLLGITVVALIALGVSGWFYSAHALPRTSLAGQSISSLSQQQVEDQLRQRVDSAKVTLTVAEQTREASLSDLGISVDVPATVDAAFSRALPLAFDYTCRELRPVEARRFRHCFNLTGGNADERCPPQGQ